MSASDPQPLRGLHHVTAICGDPQPNIDFWVGLLGLRLVKRTVNFDDPGTWHLYYGDGVGTPGTIMTFFPWTSLPPLVRARGRAGAGQVVATIFAIPDGSYHFWVDRLAGAAIDFDVATTFGERRLVLRDPDDIAVELVEADERSGAAWWPQSPIPETHAITRIRGVGVLVYEGATTAELLTTTLGFAAADEDEGARRFTLGDAAAPSVLELREDAAATPGRMGIGAVHHVAWRVADRADQERWRAHVSRAGRDVTPILDRQYFESIYFREPGGVLFEIATDPPGFTRDESVDALGSMLRLPSWLEERRGAIAARLPEIGPPRAWRL